ncbi:putative cytotoxin RtxA [Yersinia frederiksenii]|nr:putative cytotoxin RtxA [Yersinia frederiksenii]
MGKNASRSAEYFFTGKYNGDDSSEEITAIGFGGEIYARGGDDEITVGSVAAIVYTGSGDDKVEGGAAYLEVQDTSGDLSISGAAGAFNIRKQEGGNLKYRGGAIANIIEHSGNDGSIDFAGVGGYNQITRRATGSSNIRKLKLDDITLGDIRVKDNNSGETVIAKQIKNQNGAYGYIVRHKYGEGVKYLRLRFNLFMDETTGDVKFNLIKADSSFKARSYALISRVPNKYRGGYSIDSIEYSVREIHNIPMYSKPITVHTGEIADFVDDSGYKVAVNNDDNIKLSALKFIYFNKIVKLYRSESQPNIYYYQFTSKGTVSILGRIKLHMQAIGSMSRGSFYYSYEMDMFTVPEENLPLEEKIDMEYVLGNGIDSHVKQYYKQLTIYSDGSNGLDVSLSYTIDNEMKIDKRKEIINGNVKNNKTILNFTKEQLNDSNKNISFVGGGVANVINSDVDKGDVKFSGGGIANVITHRAGEGNTDFKGIGAANIVVKSGKQGDLTFDGAGLANVIVHKSDHGKMDVTAGGAVNVLVRIGDGQYHAKLIALGNISVQMGEGDSRILMFGGLNTHTQIGSGKAFWIAAGGLNVMTKKGQGSIFSIVGGGGNVVTNINSGDATIIALGLGNIITHMGDDEHHSNLSVIAVAAANVVTQKGNGDVQAILGGGINLLTQIGSGKTDAIMLGGGNILTKVGNGDTNAFMFGLGNILTHVNTQESQTLGVIVGAGNIYTKVGNGTTIGAMLAAGNMMSHIGTGDTYALMGGIGNIFTKVGDGDVLALMVAKGNILTQVGDGQTIALMLAKGGNIFTKVGDGTTIAAMVSMANIMTHIGDGETFALMAGKANIFTKVGSGLTVALMAGNVNVYSQINRPGTKEVGVGIFAGKLNVMTKVGDGTAVAIMFGKANIMTHVGDGSTGAISIAKGNIITKVGDGFTGVLAKAEGNIVTHVGKGMSVAVLHGKGNVLTKVGDDIAVGLLISDKGNIMTHVGDGLTVGIVKGKLNIVTKVGHGDGVNIAWGDSNIITHIGNGDRYNFINGKYNVITRVGQGKEFTVVKAKHNLINLISETDGGKLDSYTAAWAENNIISSVGDGQTVVLAKAKNNVITKVGEGDSYNVLWADRNISTHVGDGTKVTLAKADLNVITDIGDGLNVTAIYGKNNVNTKVGDGTSVSVMWGKLNVNTKVGDGLNVGVMKGKANANIHVGNGLSIAANYGRTNVVIKVGDGDFYNLSVASSNTQSNKLASLFNNIKQHAMGRAGSQAINYLVNGNESHTSGFKNGRGGYKISEPTNDLAGFELDSKGLIDDYKSPETSHDFQASSRQLSTINKPDIDSAKQNAERALEDTSGNLHDAANGRLYEDNSAALNSNKVAIENDKTGAENDGEKLRQEKEKHHQSSQHVQNQLASTDESALANIGAEYQQQVNQEAEELVSQHQLASLALSKLSESNIINSVNGDAGSSVRNPFAQGILSDVDRRVSQATVTADEKLTQINTDSEKYKSQVDQALAKSESAVVEGRKNAEQAKAEERTRVSVATERTAEAEGQKKSAMQSASAAENKANAMQNDARRAVDDAENKANTAKNNAKGVQQEEGDRPTDRKVAEGSGRRVGQVAYTTNAAEVSDESITDSGNTPEKIILAKADGSITKEINRNPAPDIVNSGKDAINQAVVPGFKDTMDIPEPSTYKHTKYGRLSSKYLEIGMHKYTHGKDDKSLSFEFSQTLKIIRKAWYKNYKLAKKHVTPNEITNSFNFNLGVCFALSAKYMMAERNYGVGGGKAYISWLQDVANGYSANIGKTSNIDKIQKSIMSNYYRQQFESEMISILNIQNSQSVYNRADIFACDLIKIRNEMALSRKVYDDDSAFNIINNIESKLKVKNAFTKTTFDSLRKNYVSTDIETPSDIINILTGYAENEKARGLDNYYGELKRNGINRAEKFKNPYPEQENYTTLMAQLRSPGENTFVEFDSTNHAMNITIIKKGSGYQWSFFEPNYGGVSFDNYNDFRKFMDGFTKNRNSYNRLEDDFEVNYNLFISDKDMQSVRGKWDIFRSNEQAYLLDRLKSEGIEFSLGKKMKGKITDYKAETNNKGDEKVTSFTVEVFDEKNKKSTSVQIDAMEFNSSIKKLMPHADHLNKVSDGANVKMLVGDDTIRFININTSAEVFIVKSPHSRVLGDENYDPVKVKQKERKTIHSANGDGKTRYDGQVIVQLEENTAVHEAAVNLAAKHSNSVHVKLDQQGHYQVISGDPGLLKGDIRWQLVGHGRDKNDEGKGNQTFANHSPNELAKNIKRLRGDLDSVYGIKSTPQYISLVGCRLTGENKQQGFAKAFMRAVGKEGIRADISARRARVLVDDQGRKITLDEQGNQRHKISEDKIVLHWNEQGNIEHINDDVRNNIARSTIDIHRVGATSDDSTVQGAIDRNTERYIRPTDRRTSTTTESATTDNSKQEFSYGGNISIQVGDDEFTSINWGTSNLGIKVGEGGFKTLTFGDNNVMIHIGSGMSKHSVDIGGYQAFEGVQVFVGSRNVAFNYGHSNDVIFMADKSIISPPLVNPFDHAARMSEILVTIAQDGEGEDWLATQDQQWTLSGAKKYLSDFSGLDANSSVDYDTLINLDSQTLRSGRGFTADIESTLNDKYNQWLSNSRGGQSNSMGQASTKSSQLKDLHNKAVFNIAVAGEGADIIATNSNWNFVFGDNVQSIMDINVGSLFSLSTQEYTSSGRVKTTMTYKLDDLPRQMRNKLINRLAGVNADTTLGDIFGVDYDEFGRIISRDGQEIDQDAVLKEMLEVVAEFGGEKLKVISNPEKLLDGIDANLNMGSSAITSFAQRHGLQDKAPDETDHDSVADIYTNPPVPENDQAFGFNSLNIPNLFAVMFNKDRQTELEGMVDDIKENMAKDLLNMEQKLFEFLQNSGHLIDDGDIHVSLGNYNFTFGGHGRDLAAYLGDNNNFWGGHGDDVFYGMGISNIFTGGKGNDVGVLMGRENTMFGGVGDDIAVLAGRVNTAYLGEGNDQAFIFGETGGIDTGSGQDYAVVAGNFNRLSSGSEQDYVVIIGNNNVVELGSGDDSSRVFGNQNTVYGDSGNDNIILLGYSSIIYGGTGDDKLIANSISKFSKIEAGEGNDTLDLGGYKNLFSGGIGNDCFVITEAVIDCTVSDASGGDDILFKDINWQDIWFQRSDNDLIVLVDRRIGITTEQSEFENIGSVTFSDYFAGERANIVVSIEGSTSKTILQDGALDSLVDMMSKHDITESSSDFMQQIDTSLRNNIAAAWGNVLTA